MIKEVRLINIKSYSDQTIKFAEGVNAILGENGAGKTTILEAIGFTLFDSRPYKIGDFIRRGERRGEIRVKLVSPKDERVYEVVRRFEGDRTVEYFVRDAETGVRIGGAEGVRGVSEWIKEMFGFEVDPKTLFENAVGVGQGKITSQFLENPSVRDRIFSPLIGIEGYRKAYEKSRDYERYVENRLKDVEKEIALINRDIENLKRVNLKLEKLKKERESLHRDIDKLKEKIEPMERRIKEIETIINDLNKLKIEESRVLLNLQHINT